MEEVTGYLVLSTGAVFEGKWLGKPKINEGEMVFNTAMTGYQEVVTDPSYAGQIVTLTYPLIGNYGCNDETNESLAPALAGLIISTPCLNPEHDQSHYSLCELAEKNHFGVLYDIDTRALTKIIREHGEVYGKLTMNPSDQPLQSSVDPHVVNQVSTKKIESYQTLNSNPKKHIVVIDYGYKQSIITALLQLGCHVTLVPYQTTFTQIKKLNPDAVVLSNGPGNPKNLAAILPTVRAIAESYPTLGICLGHQLIALAFGSETERLPFGHRGSNHPVKDLATSKVMITSQNHGYVVTEASIDRDEWAISYLNVNDQSVEGLKHKTKPILTVQFHPEAHPGPTDSHFIFHDFIHSLSVKGEKQHA